MPVAGEEGYEKLVICPYDRAHEIRRGRMQFHLEKCRKNYPASEMLRCPFNSTHLMPKVEEEFHTMEECASRTNWERSTYEVGDVNCPVKDLVPVNAGNIPDDEESWDDFVAPGSVLVAIKEEAANKNIYRNMQCESKGKRKNFRKQEKERHANLKSDAAVEPDDDTASFVTAHSTVSLKPLPKPSKPTMIRVERQDPAAAIAALNKQFRTLDLDMNTMAPSDTSSVYNEPPSAGASIADTASVSRKVMSYAAASSLQQTPTSASPAPSALNRPSTAMSTGASFSSRPSTAMSIAASVNRIKVAPPSADGFCQIPIPGLGRGQARRNQ